MKRHDGGIEDYPEEFLECRGDDHDWKWMTDAKIVKNTRGRIIEWTRIRKCLRCESQVLKRYEASTGRIMGNSYDYSPGYLAAKNNAIKPGPARLERLRRIGISL